VPEDGQIFGLTCMFSYRCDLAIVRNPLLDYFNISSGAENIIKFNLQRFSKIKEKQDAFVDSAWPSVIFTVAQPIKNAHVFVPKEWLGKSVKVTLLE
jgi:hypothetical protein